MKNSIIIGLQDGTLLRVHQGELSLDDFKFCTQNYPNAVDWFKDEKSVLDTFRRDWNSVQEAPADWYSKVI